MRFLTGPAGRGYAVAVGATGLTLLVRLALDPALGQRQPYSTFYVAVALTAWVGGLRPALLALALGALLGNLFFVGERWALDLPTPGDVSALVTFLVVGLAVLWLFDRAQRAGAEAARLNATLRRQADELHTVLDALPVGVFIADDPACASIRGNPTGRALLGLPADVNASKSAAGGDRLPFRILRDGVEVPMDDLPMQRVARTGLPVIGEEVDVERADGSVVRLYEHVVPLFDPTGNVRGCVAAFVDVTALRRAEQGLRESQDLLRVIIDSVPPLVTYVDPDHRYRLVNRTYERWFGRAPDEVQGRPVVDLLGEPAYQAIRPYMERVLAGEEITFEQTLPYKVGGTRAVRVSYTPDRGPDGRVRGYVALVDDVTDRKQAQEALRQSEERLRLFIDYAPAAIAMFDQDMRYLAVSRRWLTDYNLTSRGDLIGRSHYDVFPEIPDRWRDIHRRGLAGEVVQADEDPFERADGTVQWVRWEVRPWHGADGAVGGIIVLAEEITGRKRAEEDLRGTADRLAFALTAARMGDWTWDAASDEVRLSDRAAELFGIPARPARTRPKMRELLHPDDRPRVAADLDRVIAEKADYDIEYRVRKPDGGWRWVAAKGRAVYDSAGQVTGMSGVMLDVTDRRCLEEELRRTVDALREGDRLKDEFLAMLAHELRNPLAPIRNALHVLKKPAADAEVRDQVRATAERQVGHMARLLDDLLDVSRISRGKIQLRSEPVDLAALAARTAEAARPLVDERRHTLAVSVPPTGAWVTGDATRLEQVVTNLLTNAAKYTDPGGRIALAVEAADGHAVVRVTDTGIGIAADMLPRVFDLFVQAERRLDRSQGGMGIGLTLVKRLVELHGGSIEAHSDGPGRGSEFVVRLPLASNESRVTSNESRPHSSLITRHSSLPRRVLVVDDNRDAADSLAVLLRIDGHEVTVAYDGPAAVALAPGLRPDVVFLDLGMPGLDGFEVCRRLRRLPELDGVRVVAVTGWGQETHRRQSAEAGFDYHLVKPADPDTVRKLV